MFKAGSSWLVIALCITTPRAKPAVISGHVSLRGPSIPEYFDGYSRDGIHVPIKGNADGLSEALIYVKRGLEGKNFPPPNEPARLLVEDHRFNPRMLAMRRGQALHYIRRTATAGPIHFGVMHEGRVLTNVTVSAKYPVIHTMHEPLLFLKHQSLGQEAHVCVLDHPYFQVTDITGNFRLPHDLPPGKYTIAARHPYTEEQEQEITVQADQAIELKFRLQVPGAIPTLTGQFTIEEHLHRLRIKGFKISQANLGALLEKLDEAFREADPEGRSVPLMLDPRAVPPSGSPRLHEVEFQDVPAPAELSAAELLRLLIANARTPITRTIRDDGIQFSFRHSDAPKDMTKEALNRKQLLELKDELADALAKKRTGLAADHPGVMQLKQRLARIGTQLTQFIQPKEIDPIINRSYPIISQSFRINITSLAPGGKARRTPFPQGIESVSFPYDDAARQTYHWALRDLLEDAGVRFTNGLPEIIHNHATDKLLVRSRTSQAERLRYWVESIHPRPQRVLLESHWLEIPHSVSEALPKGPLSPDEFQGLWAKFRSRPGANELSLPRLVNLAPRRGEFKRLTEVEVRRGAPGNAPHEILAGPTLTSLVMVDAGRKNIWLELEATHTGFVGYADPQAYNPGGGRNFHFPISREISLRANTVMPDGHTLALSGVQTNFIYDPSRKVPTAGGNPLRRKSIFSKRKNAERKSLVIFVTATMINPAGDPINPPDGP